MSTSSSFASPTVIPNYFERDLEPSLWRTRWEKIGEEKEEFQNLHSLRDFGFRLKVPPSGPGVHRLSLAEGDVAVTTWPGGQGRQDKISRRECKIRFIKKVQVWRMCGSNAHIELPLAYGMEMGKFLVEFIVWKRPCPQVPVVTLDDMIEKSPGKITEADICLVLHDIAWILAVMHSKGVVHWDVTTSTIRQHSFPGLVVYKLGGAFDNLQREDLRRLASERRAAPSYEPPFPTNNAAKSAGWDTYALGVCGLQLARGLKKEDMLTELKEGKVGPTAMLSQKIRDLLLRMVDIENQPKLVNFVRGLEGGKIRSEPSEW